MNNLPSSTDILRDENTDEPAADVPPFAEAEAPLHTRRKAILFARAAARSQALRVLLLIVTPIAVWEVAIQSLNIPPYIMPSPSAVAKRMTDGVAQGFLLRHTLVTLGEVLGGYFAGAVLGIAFGTLIALSRLAEKIVYPYIVAFNSVPKIALTPIIILWVGVGVRSTIIVVALLAFFPLLVNVVAGLRSVDPGQTMLLRSLAATRWQIFRFIQVPNALPSMFAGLEIAVVLAVVGAVVGEFVGAREGLGYYILLSNTLLDTAGMFAAFILLAMIGIVVHSAVKLVSRRVIFWTNQDPILPSA